MNPYEQYINKTFLSKDGKNVGLITDCSQNSSGKWVFVLFDVAQGVSMKYPADLFLEHNPWAFNN